VPDLEISLEKVCALVDHAHAIDVKVDVVEPDYGSNSADDDMRQVLEAYADDASFSETQEFIEGLNIDEQIALVALTWVGRGTFSVDEWEEAVAEARRAHNRHTATYLLGIPLLGDYLEDGLDALGYSCA
jgi:hypothetical protein